MSNIGSVGSNVVDINFPVASGVKIISIEQNGLKKSVVIGFEK